MEIVEFLKEFVVKRNGKVVCYYYYYFFFFFLSLAVWPG